MSFRSVRRMILPAVLLSASFAVPGANAVPPVTPLNCVSANTDATVTAYGATFQIKAQVNAFIPQYTTDCPGTNEGTVSYNTPLPPSSGSGKCIDLTVNHTPPVVGTYVYAWAPYCGSDDPLTSQQWATANSTGLVVNQIPVAVGADAIVYNASCPANFSLTSGQLSGIFAGTITDFSAVGCAAQPITRVVRNAGSGTTCIFKSYLAKRNPDPWQLLNAQTGCGSTTWPAGSTPIVTANGNSGMVSTVSTTPGAISYPDLASNVNATNGLINPVARVKTAQQEIQGVPGELPYLGSATAVGAANCQGNSPTPGSTTSPGWDAVTISDGPQGYPICGFTYDFIFTRCTDFGTSLGVANAGEQCKIAQDLIASALTDAGQAQLGPDHYSPLPQNALNVARVGVQAIL